MRTVALLAGFLLPILLVPGCARGTDPWDDTGWNVESFDDETDVWTPNDECGAPTPCTPAPCRAPQAPPTRAPAPGRSQPPPPAWPRATAPAPRPAVTQPVPRSAPAVPPPPPPPYPLPR